MTELKCPVDGCRQLFRVEPPIKEAIGSTVDCPNCGTCSIIEDNGSLTTMRFFMSKMAQEYFGTHKQFRHGFIEVTI